MGYEDEMEDFHDEKEFNKKQLEQLKKEILDEAKKVVENYVDNPSDISGSVINIHENSPLSSSSKNGLFSCTLTTLPDISLGLST